MIPNPYLAGGAILIIALLGWQLTSALKKNGELQAQLEQAAADIDAAAAANETTMITITELEVAISDMIAERRAEAKLREQVLDEREQQLADARAEADRLREQREAAFDESPDCELFASINVESVCPAVGRELRQRAASKGDR